MTTNTASTVAEPTHDEVALSAFLAWEKEGRPHGSDLAYWFRAEAELRSLKQKKTEARVKPWPPVSSSSRTITTSEKQKLTTDAKRSTTVKTKPVTNVTKTAASRPTRPTAKSKR